MLSFDFDVDYVKVFTDGDCWLLAAALNKLTGWPVVTAQVQNEVDNCYHAAVLTPEEEILDITGLWFPEEWHLWLDNYGRKEYMVVGRPDSAEEMVNFGWRTWYPYVDADLWAQKVLDKYNAEAVR